MNGGYDLYFSDGENVFPLSELNTDKNELGADFFPCRDERDLNNDGEFGIADLVLFSEWLLGAADKELYNWRNADICCDERLNVFDLCVLRKEFAERQK